MSEGNGKKQDPATGESAAQTCIPQGVPVGQLVPGALASMNPLVTETFAGADSDGNPVVVLKAETAIGMLVLMFEPAHAARVSREMAKAARVAGSGLTIVGDV